MRTGIQLLPYVGDGLLRFDHCPTACSLSTYDAILMLTLITSWSDLNDLDNHLTKRAATMVESLWSTSPPLTAVGMLMLVGAGACWWAIPDPQLLTGAPAWLKPFKFAISTAVYSLTLAWIFLYLSDWPRIRRIVGWATAVLVCVEVAIIDAQAWRGTTSHFNVSTPLNMTLFRHGSCDHGANVCEYRGCGRAMAAALRRSGARMGAAPHDADDHRRAGAH